MVRILEHDCSTWTRAWLDRKNKNELQKVAEQHLKVKIDKKLKKNEMMEIIQKEIEKNKNEASSSITIFSALRRLFSGG